jgi:hypothetical protein
VGTVVLGRSMAGPLSVAGLLSAAGLMWDAMVNAGARGEEGQHRVSKFQETRAQDIQCNPPTRLVPEGKGELLGEQRVYIRQAFGLV